MLFHLRALLGILVLLPAVGCSDRAERAAELGQLAARQLEDEQIQAARASINEAIEKRDDISALHLLRGRIELKAQALASAFSAYENALALEPSNVEALEGVAQLGLRTSNLRESEAAVDQLLIMNPLDVNSLTLKGVHFLIRKKSSEALTIADRILAIDPLSEAGTILKARALYRQGQAKDGLNLLLALDSKNKPRSEAMAVSLLEFYRESNNAQGMLEQFGLLKRFRPADVDLRVDEANARYKLGHVKEARTLLHWALRRKDISSEQAEAVARLWSEYDAVPLRLPELQALQTEANVNARLVISRHFLDEGNQAAALIVLSGLQSDNAEALRARAAVASGAPGAGLHAAERILKRDERHCDALVARAAALLSTKAYASAIEAAQLASATCPRMASAYIALADSYSRLGDSAAVRRVFTDALANIPQSSRLTRRFAEWLEAKDEPVRAVATARRLTNKAPALVSGWTLLYDLCVRSEAQECATEAKFGLAQARIRLAIDLPPGEDPSRSLFGRLRK